jgi:plasmid stabilization system protein ParE
VGRAAETVVIERYRIIIQPRAGRDLDLIHAYIAKDSEQNAAGMVRKILDSIAKLDVFPGQTPLKGRGRKLRRPVRSVTVWPYVIHYHVHEQDRVVEVVHIRHGARRRPRKFD